MPLTASSLWATHWMLWQRAIAGLWKHRHTLVLLTVVLWVPWRLAVPLLEEWLQFREFAGFPLSWVSDAFYEPLYAGAVLALLADQNALPLPYALLRGLWLMPRLLLIDFKIALWGLAAPYLVLHLGSAALLTWFPTPMVARIIIGATIASMVWMLIVVLRYFTASAILVAERQSVGQTSPEENEINPFQLWFGSGNVSTGWSLWAARQFARGRMLHALLVLVVGQGVVSLVMALVPPGESVVMQVVNGVAMLATALWWGLVWEFASWCIGERAARAGAAIPLPARRSG